MSRARMIDAAAVFFVVAALVLWVLLSGCAAIQTGCQVVRLVDAVCTDLVLADGSHIKLARGDVADPARFAAALKRGGSCQ
jgi:hypothetical protein